MRAVEAKALEARARAQGRPGWCVVCVREVEDWLAHVYSNQHREAAYYWDRENELNIWPPRQGGERQ